MLAPLYDTGVKSSQLERSGLPPRDVLCHVFARELTDEQGRERPSDPRAADGAQSAVEVTSIEQYLRWRSARLTGAYHFELCSTVRPFNEKIFFPKLGS